MYVNTSCKFSSLPTTDKSYLQQTARITLLDDALEGRSTKWREKSTQLLRVNWQPSLAEHPVESLRCENFSFFTLDRIRAPRTSRFADAKTFSRRKRSWDGPSLRAVNFRVMLPVSSKIWRRRLKFRNGNPLNARKNTLSTLRVRKHEKRGRMWYFLQGGEEGAFCKYYGITRSVTICKRAQKKRRRAYYLWDFKRVQLWKCSYVHRRRIILYGVYNLHLSYISFTFARRRGRGLVFL